MDPEHRKLITCNRMHPPKANLERFYIKRENDGRELIQVKLTFETTNIGLKKSFDTRSDWMLHLVSRDEKQKKKKYSLRKESNKFANQLPLTLKNLDIEHKETEL